MVGTMQQVNQVGSKCYVPGKPSKNMTELNFKNDMGEGVAEG